MHFNQLDDKRAKVTQQRKEVIQSRYDKQLSSALEQYTAIISYRPGVCNARAGPSVDIMTDFTAYCPAINDFVVLPYVVKW